MARSYPFHPVKTAGALLLAGAATFGFTNWNAVSLMAPTIAPITGAVASGQRTLEGTGAKNGKVQVFVNGAAVGIADVDANGNWKLETNLPAGAVNVVAKAFDGKVASLESAPLELNLKAPFEGLNPMAEGEGISVYTPQLQDANGFLAADEFNLAGLAPQNTKLEVLENGMVLGNVVAGADGQWSYKVKPTGTGDIDYLVRPEGKTSGALYTLNIAPKGATAAVCPCKLRFILTNPKAQAATVKLTGSSTVPEPVSAIIPFKGKTATMVSFIGLDSGNYDYTIEQPGFKAFSKSASLPKNRSISVYLDAAK
ncbi:MAG: hypothetical protein ACK41E_10045 [Deinococcales bacterium]